MTLTFVLQNVFNGIAIGSVYAIFALGYTLIFSILRVINFAHGAVFTLGAYFTYVLLGSKFGFNGLLANLSAPIALPFLLAMFLGAVLAGLCGIFVERVAFRPLRKRGADPLLSLVSSLGVAVAIVNLIQYLVGAEAYSYPDNAFGSLPPAINFGGTPPILIRTKPIIILIACLIIVILLTYLINRTKLGKALQAISEDAVTASLLGINADRLILFTFFLSGFLGGLAGTLVGVNFSIAGPSFGITYGLRGLAVIVLGGLGDIPGAVIGGFIIGIAEASIGFLPSQYSGLREAVPFVVLFLVLLIRPQGILGRALIQKV